MGRAWGKTLKAKQVLEIISSGFTTWLDCGCAGVVIKKGDGGGGAARIQS
jgi:hypothetical protein